MKPHSAQERRRLAAIRGVRQIGQRDGCGPKVFAINVDFRRRRDVWARDFERNQRHQRLRFQTELERRALRYARADPNRFVRERRRDGPKAFRVLSCRMQRRHRGERFRNHIAPLRAGRVKHLSVAHPIEIRAAHIFPVARHFDIDCGHAEHRHHNAFGCGQTDARAERSRLHHDRAGFIPRG